MAWRFVIPHAPRAKNTRHTNPATGFQFVPREAKQWQALVALSAAPVLPKSRIEGALRLEILAVLPRPQRLGAKKYPDGLMLAPTNRRLDAENIAKGVNDGLARWFDDGCVVELVVRKRYAEKNGLARVEVVLEALEESAADIAA